MWPTDWLHGAIYTSSASLQEKRTPATEVNEVRGKETGQDLTAKETRVVQIGRDDEEKKVTEYYSNDTRKAETSQGLDNRQGKKLREGSVEVVGSTALQGHCQNLRPKATGAGAREQPGVTKPRAAKTKAVPKATVETEQGSQQEGVPTGPVGGNPTPIQKRSRNPQAWKPSKVKTPKRENRR